MNLVELLFRPAGGWGKSVEHPLVSDKLFLLKPFIEDKCVLDCGCVGEGEEDIKIHEFIRKHAKECVGVDNKRDGVEVLNEKGFDVLCADIEELDLSRQFDVVFAGEVLEHLSNPGLFLERVYLCLKDDGRLVITTPNQYFITMLVRSFFGIGVRVNPEHTCWFTPDTLTSLLRRYKFRVDEIVFCQHKSRWWINILVKFRRNLARTIIVVASKI